MFILAFSVSYSEIILYAYVFFDGLEINTGADAFDLVFCLMVLLGGAGLIAKGIHTVKEANKTVKKEGTVASYADKH